MTSQIELYSTFESYKNPLQNHIWDGPIWLGYLMLTNIYSRNSAFCILVLLSPQGSVGNFYNIFQSSKPVCQHLSLSHVKDSCSFLRFSALISSNSFSSSWQESFWLTSMKPLGLKWATSKQWPHHKQSNLYIHSTAQYPAQSTAKKGRNVFWAILWGMTSRAGCFFCSSQINKILYKQ